MSETKSKPIKLKGINQSDPKNKMDIFSKNYGVGKKSIEDLIKSNAINSKTVTINNDMRTDANITPPPKTHFLTFVENTPPKVTPNYLGDNVYSRITPHFNGGISIPNYTASPTIRVDAIDGINTDTNIGRKITQAFRGVPRTDYIVAPHVASLIRSIWSKV